MAVGTHDLALIHLFLKTEQRNTVFHASDVSDLIAVGVVKVHDVRRVTLSAISTRLALGINDQLLSNDLPFVLPSNRPFGAKGSIVVLKLLDFLPPTLSTDQMSSFVSIGILIVSHVTTTADL
jgi:hypothetical protein